MRVSEPNRPVLPCTRKYLNDNLDGVFVVTFHDDTTTVLMGSGSAES